MANAADETRSVPATVLQPDHAIIPAQPASDSEPRGHETQMELAFANWVAILRQLSVSIAELNHPISAVVMNAEAALRLLLAQPTDTEAVRRVLGCIVKDGMRTGDIIHRTRALIEKTPPRREWLEINAVALEAIDVTHDELVKNGVSVQMKLAKDLPLVQGDRVQLLQVMVNLIVNAVEAMRPHAAGARDLLIRTVKTKSGSVLVTVCDSGPGVEPKNLERIFDAFFTTKADGWGMGLSICRAIIQGHGGDCRRPGARPTAPSCSSPYRQPRTTYRELALIGASRACAIESVVGTFRKCSNALRTQERGKSTRR